MTPSHVAPLRGHQWPFRILSSSSGQLSTLRGIDDTGAELWQRSYPLGEQNQLGRGLLPLPDATPWLVGAIPFVGETVGVLMRADAWGHISCAEAGKCAPLASADCDDGDTCTADLCHAADGCKHSPLDGVVCGVDIVREVGACVAGP